MRLAVVIGTLIVSLIWAEPAPAQTFDFVQLDDQRVRFLVNGISYRTLNYRRRDQINFEISRSTLRRLGVRGNIFQQANADLQNNVFRRRDRFAFDIAKDYALGSIEDERPVERPLFDFRRVREYGVRLYINGQRANWLNYSRVSERSFKIKTDKLVRQLGISEDEVSSLIHRQFGNNAVLRGNSYRFTVSKERAIRNGDPLFLFEQQRKNGFRLFINGRKSRWINLNRFEDDPEFEISSSSFANRFGFTGSVEDIISTFSTEDVSIEENGEGNFNFRINRELFLEGGDVNVENLNFVVRRNLASLS